MAEWHRAVGPVPLRTVNPSVSVRRVTVLYCPSPPIHSFIRRPVCREIRDKGGCSLVYVIVAGVDRLCQRHFGCSGPRMVLVCDRNDLTKNV